MITKFKVSGKSDHDAGVAENGRSDQPMDVTMGMVTAAAIAEETAGAGIFEPMERNEN